MIAKFLRHFGIGVPNLQNISPSQALEFNTSIIKHMGCHWDDALKVYYYKIKGSVRSFIIMIIWLSMVLMNDRKNNKLLMEMKIWLTLTLMMIMIDNMVQLNMKTHMVEASDNRTHGLNMELLTETTLVAHLVLNNLFLPCLRTCVLSNESSMKRRHLGVMS